MANEKIVLAELDLDTKGLLQAAAESRDAVDKLTKALQQCKDAGSGISPEMKSIEAALEKATQAYEAQKDALTVNLTVNQTLIKSQKNFTSIQQDTLVAVGKVTVGVEKQSKTFNDYKKQAADGFSQLNIFNGGLSGLAQRAKDAGGAGNLFTGAMGNMATGIKGMGDAISANPIGILLKILGPVIDQLKNFAPLTTAVQKAMAALEPVMQALNIPIEAIAKTIIWVLDGFTSLMGAMSGTAKGAVELQQSQQRLAVQMALQDAANEKAKQQMDELRKKSEDLSLTELERADALKELADVENKNYAERKKNSDMEYANALSGLQLKKKLSADEIRILEDGDAASVQKLMDEKNISSEELDTLQKAKTQKISIAAEETAIKQSQAEALKGIINGLIEKTNDQSLTDEQRRQALVDATKIELDEYNKRKKAANDYYYTLLKNTLSAKGFSDDQIKQMYLEGDAYKNKSAVISTLTKSELLILQNAQKQREGLAGEEIALHKKTGAEMAQLNQNLDNENAERVKAQQAESKRLADERKQKAQADARDAIELQKLQLQSFIDDEGKKAQSLKEEIAAAEEVAKRKQAIAQAEFNASEKKEADELKLRHASSEIEIANMKAQADATAKYAKAELDLWMANNDSKIQSGVLLTRDIINEEAVRLAYIKDAKIKELEASTKSNLGIIQAKKAANEALSAEDMEYLAKKQQLEDEFKKQTQANDEALDKQNKDQKVAQLAADREVALATAQTQYDEDILTEQQRYDDQIAHYKDLNDKKLISDEQFEQLKKEAKAKNDANEKAIDDAKTAAIMQQYESLFGGISQLLGKKTAAGKAAAIAEATINTYNGITQVWASDSILPEPLATVAKAVNTGVVVASGLAAVKKITGTKTPKAEKGALFSIGGQRHSAGGTLFTGADGTQFEAERGELIGVMNRNAAQHFMAFNNAFPAGGGHGGNYFASGGIVSREIARKGLDTDELAAKIAQANRSIPAPVVAVQDIVAQGNSYVQVRERANF